jgi:putative spermidine/putrescine transport system permease protein/mannopine transport system permease protein
MLVIYAYPVVNVLFRSLTDPEPGIGNFVDAAQDPIVARILWITVRLALEVAIITAVLGFPVAYFMTTLSPRWSRMVGLLVIIPFWTSVLVRSFAWIVLLGDDGLVARLLEPVRGNTTGMLYTEPAVVIAMTHVLLPYTTLIIKASLDQIDPSLVRAARTLGAGPVRAYLRVYMPLATPAIISSTMLVFIMGLGYYITPALVGGSGQTTIAMLIQQNVTVTFQWGVAATLAVLLLAASLILFAIVRRFTKSTGGVVSP